MNAELFKQKQQELWNRMDLEIGKQEKGREVIFDGVGDIEGYLSQDFKVLWVLKEAYDDENGLGGGWEYHDMFSDDLEKMKKRFNKPDHTTWHPIVYATYGIEKEMLWSDIPDIKDKPEITFVVRKTAFMNTQKLPARGQTNTDMADLWESMRKYSSLLKLQFDLIDADIIIFGNTFAIWKDNLGLNDRKLINHDFVNYTIYKGKLFIDAYHPAAKLKGLTKERYVNNIIEIAIKFKNGEIKEEND